MKKFLLFIALCVTTLTASAQQVVYPYDYRICTFEDGSNSTYWAGKIDSPQYDGSLLYSRDSTFIYSWFDSTTNLYSAIPLNYRKHWYSGGGEAISNYWNGIISQGDYLHQLSVYVPNNSSSGRGNHGYYNSQNFAVHFGYKDGSEYNETENLPYIAFQDGVARKICGMYVNNTTYFVNVARNGNGFSPAMTNGNYVDVMAYGYDNNGLKDSISFNLAYNTTQITDWTYWDLSSLGNVTRVEFNVVGNVNTIYGFSMPAYFCYDNIKVDYTIYQSIERPGPFDAPRKTSPTEVKKINVFINEYGINFLSGDVPEGTTYTFETPKPDVPIRLNAGQSNKLTISGLPKNVRITDITASGYTEQLFGEANITASIGEEEIGKVAFCGMFKESGIQIEAASEVDLPFTMNEGDHFIGDNDFILQAKCTNKYAVIKAYEISYVLEEDSNDEPAVATFEDLALEPESYWAGDEDGDDWYYGLGYTQRFKSGQYSFVNYCIPDYQTWIGYAVSNQTSTEFSTTADQFKSCVGSGNNGSANYCVAYPDGTMWGETLSIEVEGGAKVVPGFYITNSAYVVNSITKGDSFAGDPFTVGDYFKVTIHALDADGNETAKRDFCLADYRFENEADRYYVNDWQYVDLSQLGEAAAFTFTFDGSRSNAYGLTTPTYFCIDDFGAEGKENVREEGDVTTGIKGLAIDRLTIDNCIYTIDGRRVQNANRPGIYIVNGRKMVVK